MTSDLILVLFAKQLYQICSRNGLVDGDPELDTTSCLHENRLGAILLDGR